jgi:hypothetical protein
VLVGKTDKHVCIRIGPWTFFLAIDADARFPNTNAVIPEVTSSATTCRLAGEDAAFLMKALPRLPGQDEENAPLTLDLNGKVVLRGKDEGQSRPMELVLSRSEVSGPPLRLVSSREYLARAIQLGFTEWRVLKPETPVVCRDEHRTYLWMPLSKEGALPPSEDALRIHSSGEEPITQPKQERRREIVSKPASNGPSSNGHGAAGKRSHQDGQSPVGTSMAALIEEAQAIREVLHETYGRMNRLLATLKRQRKQSRLMAATLASLKQLQAIQD